MFNTPIDFDSLPTGEFDALPEGEYKAIVEEIKKVRWIGSEKKDITHSNIAEDENDVVEVNYQIVDGAHKGRLYFDKLRLWHANQTASNIARARFKELCIACGKNPAANIGFQDLYNIPVNITIKHAQSVDANGKPYVNVTRIRPAGMTTPSKNTSSGFDPFA